MIRVTGPNWKTTRALQAALAEVPETGTFNFGTMHCNKLEQLQRMTEAGVGCVPVCENFNKAFALTHGKHMAAVLGQIGHLEPEGVGDVEIWLGRKLHHTQGKDILLPDNKFWRIRDYWTKFIPSTEEWRIHIFDGKSIARGKKVLADTTQVPNTPINIRNRGRNWLMVHAPNPPRGMRELARRAVAAVGETYGAVDILVGTDRKFYVLEVNCAPAMDEYTLAAYVKAIRKRFANAG